MPCSPAARFGGIRCHDASREHVQHLAYVVGSQCRNRCAHDHVLGRRGWHTVCVKRAGFGEEANRRPTPEVARLRRFELNDEQGVRFSRVVRAVARGERNALSKGRVDAALYGALAFYAADAVPGYIPV